MEHLPRAICYYLEDYSFGWIIYHCIDGEATRYIIPHGMFHRMELSAMWMATVLADC